MKRLPYALLMAAALGHGDALASEPQQATMTAAELYERFNQRKNDFEKYIFLTSASVQGSPEVIGTAKQLLATEYSFLGRPNDALRTYVGAARPFDVLPKRTGHVAFAADAWVSERAKDYAVVMVNEAHHAPQTRLLVLALLPKLRAQGYTHFAVETLINDGTEIMPSGYPTEHTGFYTREPIFAEIIREASRLGYVLVPYEASGDASQTQQQRETGQAENLFAKTLAAHPKAKVLVHAGYGHIGKAPKDMPDSAKPMAMEFERISGVSVLSVDQASLQPYLSGNGKTAHDLLNAEFAVSAPTVLVDNETRKAWSANPGLYDAAILLPATPDDAIRPDWLSLSGKRRPVPMDAQACAGRLPCLIEARAAAEGDDAVPADRFLVLHAEESRLPLYLAPGRYRIRVQGPDGVVLAQSALEVPAAGDD